LGMRGRRLSSLRVMPRELVGGSDLEQGFWWRWSLFVMRRPLVVAAAGLAIVAVLLVPAVQLNPAEAQAKDLAGKPTEDAVIGLNALTAAGISPGVLKPFDVLVEHSPGPAGLRAVVDRLEHTPRIDGAVAPRGTDGQGGPPAFTEAFPAADGAAKSVRGTISSLQDSILPKLEYELGGETVVTLGGAAPEDRDFVHAVYGKFPYVLAFVILLTFV